MRYSLIAVMILLYINETALPLATVNPRPKCTILFV